MAETTLIVQTLKKLLKQRGFTYFHIADKLNLSEASIKKMLSQNKVSLDRLDKMCELLNMEISDLIEELNNDQQSLQSLSYEDELRIVNDLKLLIVAVSVLSGIDFQNIVRIYEISESDCRTCFQLLHEMKIIRLLSDDRYKLNIRKNFSWISSGPIESYFHNHLKEEFFNSKFDQHHERLVIATGRFSVKTRNIVANKLEKLAIEFGQLDDEDRNLPFREKRGCTMVLAFREWQTESFQSMMRNR